MKELKFRIYHKKKEKFYKVTTIYFYKDSTDIEYADVSSLVFSDPDDAIIMQYIGIKDKNDKEIYEGDIIRISDKIIVVSQIDNLSYFICNLSGNKLEIIGNIFKNPELLRKTDEEKDNKLSKIVMV